MFDYKVLNADAVAAHPALEYEPGETFAICECCGEPIHKATDFLDGEEYVELVPDEYIHVDCISAWVREHKKEAV